MVAEKNFKGFSFFLNQRNTIPEIEMSYKEKITINIKKLCENKC